jgi:1-acyl-sn-glycerol-3-phosphate acyltransferase
VIYSLLRSASRIALRWYYSDVTVVGAEHVPLDGPLFVAVNHPNALVDVLVAGQAVPRRLMFTAKATLFTNPFVASTLGALGVLPLRRASDETSPAKAVDPTRNAQSFDAVADALARSAAVLIFPEGKSHDEPAMAPSKTGAARMILHARDTKGVKGIRVLPIGLIFERKERPRSSIVALVGEAIDVDSLSDNSAESVRTITAAIDSALRNLTLNYSSVESAERDARLARTLEAIIRFEAPSVAGSTDFRERAEIARVLPSLRETLTATHETKLRALALESELLAFDARLRSQRISLDDFTISRRLAPGSVFLLRELGILAIAGPVAVWGWLNHLIPFRAALLAGQRVKHSNADPAMRTILAGAAFVLMMYMLQGATVALIAGPWWGLAYVVSLPVAADINLRMRDRLYRAFRRARAYLEFRARPSLQDDLTTRARELRGEAVSLAHASGFTRLR